MAVTRTSALVGLAGAIALAIGLAVDPAAALGAYLAAWTAAITIAVGALAMLLIGYAANARWPAAVRRPCEAIAGAIAPLAVLFVPLVFGASYVWPWVDHPVAGRKAAWLSLPFFTARSFVYFAVWIVAAELLRRWSRRRDARPASQAGLDTDALDRERGFACALLIPCGLALTFGAFDWLMSLQPAWKSTVFGLYLTAGALGAGLALVIVVAWRGVRARALPLSGHHFHAMGRLLLAYVILWAYLAYFQAFLIQIADRPDEVTFYIRRTAGNWRTATLALVALRFALPFPALVSRRLKFRPAFVGAIALIVLAGHYVDTCWLVGMDLSWLHVAAPCAVFGLATLAAARRMRGVPLAAEGDPYFQTGLAYQSKT